MSDELIGGMRARAAGREDGPSVLFITRKYPPARGGMEEFSARLFAAYRGRKRLVALRRGQRWLPVFLMRALAEAFLGNGRAGVIHLGDALLAPLAAVIDARGQVPVVVTLHGQDFARRAPGYRKLMRGVLPGLEGNLVAVSAFSASLATTIAGVNPCVIANGVNLDRFSARTRLPGNGAARQAAGIPGSGPIIAMVGRLVERKGAAWFAEHVLRRLGPDVSLVVAGMGPEAGRLRALAERDNRIVLLGAVPDEVVDAVYACADLVVAPNIPIPGRPEGYGIAPAEAAAAGVPVLVSDLEGLRDMAEVTGLRRIPPGDTGAWEAAVRRALDTPEWARSARQPRSWAQVATDYARFFTSATPRAARRSTGRPP